MMFLDKLAQTAPDGWAVLFSHNTARPDGFVALMSGRDPGLMEAYNNYYALKNPWAPLCAIKRVGLGTIADDLFPHERLVKTEYFNDFLLPNATQTAAGVAVDRDDDRSMLISTLTSRVDPDRNRALADQFTRLAPHLKRAADFYRKGPYAVAATELGASLFDAVHIGMIMVGDKCRVKVLSKAGQQMLEGGGPVRVSPVGRVAVRIEQAQSVLEDMLERAYAGPRAVGFVSDAMKLTLVHMPKDHLSRYFEGPSVMLMMEPPTVSESLFDERKFALAYRLTRAETRALAGIIDGSSVDEIASQTALSRETIRTQIKALYAKTGVSGEAELLRLVYSGRARRR